jgi:hypothetical protein
MKRMRETVSGTEIYLSQRKREPPFEATLKKGNPESQRAKCGCNRIHTERSIIACERLFGRQTKHKRRNGGVYLV